jgi:uncharacterized protein YbbC (DUF1343 family)
MKKLSFLCVVLSFLCGVNSSIVAQSPADKLQLGADQIEEILPLLENKRVGLVVNQTSVLSDGYTHILDTLLHRGVNVTKVFAPEHGFRGTGDAGEEIRDSKDIRTGVPILSLYGKNKKPSSEQVADVDVVIFDIQDVGTRFFTYISTMHYMMERCAADNKKLIILDRPNPNDFVDGPVLEPTQRSFVGMHPIPLLHGLTIGELALMINGEGWLKSTPDSCQLSIIPVKRWKHGEPYWLPVKPSPNLPNDQSIRLYPSLCFFEATPMSVGRGTYTPFQVVGYPDSTYGAYSFTPISLPGYDKNPINKDKACFGVDLTEYPFEGGLTLQFFIDFYQKAGKDDAFFFSRASWFDLLAGTKTLRKQIISGLSEDEIRASWQPQLKAYNEMREKYLLY